MRSAGLELQHTQKKKLACKMQFSKNKYCRLTIVLEKLANISSSGRLSWIVTLRVNLMGNQKSHEKN